MPNRNPLDLGCAYGNTPRKDDQKAQEIKDDFQGRSLRGRCPQTVHSSKDRDHRTGQKALGLLLQFAVGEALSGDARSHGHHATKIVQVTVVERERALSNVAVRVLWGVVSVGALSGALVEVPERLDGVRVNVPAHVLTDAVINGLVVVVAFETEVRPSLVGVDGCPALNPRTNASLDGLGRYRLHDGCHKRTTALQGTVDGNLVGVTRSMNLALAVGDVHVLRESANVRLGPVSLHGARQLLERPACHSHANAVIHEPRGL